MRKYASFYGTDEVTQWINYSYFLFIPTLIWRVLQNYQDIVLYVLLGMIIRKDDIISNIFHFGVRCNRVG